VCVEASGRELVHLSTDGEPQHAFFDASSGANVEVEDLSAVRGFSGAVRRRAKRAKAAPGVVYIGKGEYHLVNGLDEVIFQEQEDAETGWYRLGCRRAEDDEELFVDTVSGPHDLPAVR
jgi:hypothetical protein